MIWAIVGNSQFCPPGVPTMHYCDISPCCTNEVLGHGSYYEVLKKNVQYLTFPHIAITILAYFRYFEINYTSPGGLHSHSLLDASRGFL